MTPDKVLIKHLLAILNRIGPAGIEENALITELDIAACRPLTRQQAIDTIVFCADKGWTGSRRDDFDQTRIWLTESGKTILAGM